MLRENQDRICTFFAVDYDLRMGTGLSAAVDLICRERKPARYGVGPNLVHDFHWPDARQRMYVTPKRIAFETLGLGPWLDDLNSHLDVTEAALKSLGVDQFSRIGFKATAILPLNMTQAEILTLMFGTFLAQKESLSPVLGQKIDALVHFEGEHSGFGYGLDLTALTAEQASSSFLRLSNLSQMTENRLDTGIQEFHDRVTKRDSFLFDVDVFQKDVDASNLRKFTESAFEFADTLAQNCIQHLHSLPDTEFHKYLDEMRQNRQDDGLAGTLTPSLPPFSSKK